jgi:pimeloyl-ACP methyl ester carboxylesterase
MWSVTISILLLSIVSLNEAFVSPALNKIKFNEKFGINSNYESKDVRYAYYTQWRDHFDSSDFSTFDQRIYINDAHYNLFGPVFIFVGAQLSEYDYWLENSFVAQINEEQFGVVYGIEPRFYGESRPTDDLSDENLRLLTIDQTLADLADFTRFLRLELQTKFILFGYGDGAAFATLAHQTFPDLFDGVWAVGAPTYIKFNYFDYFINFQDMFLGYDRSCASIVGGGLEELDALIVAGDVNRVHELFGFQQRINLDNSNEVGLVFYTISSLLALNFDYGTQTDLTNLCVALLESASQGLSAVESLAQELGPITQNINPSWDDSVALLSEISWNAPAVMSGERQFWYMACSERSFFRTSEYLPEPVRSRFLINVFLNLCYEVFGIKSTDIVIANMQSNAKYRIRTNLTNVFFTHGGLDPDRLVGVTTDLNSLSPAEVIPGFGKVFELLRFLPQDYLTSEMVAVRTRVRSHILSIIQN